MSYECECEVFEGEQAEFSEERFVLAAKAHQCCECHDMIERGDLHQVIAYKYEGEFGENRTCLFCVDERARLSEKYSDMPPVIGELACWLMDELRSSGDEL